MLPRRSGYLIAACLAALVGDAGAAGEPRSVAFFGVRFINVSPEATRPDEEARVAAAAARLREGMAASGRYDFLDTGPVAGKAALYDNLAHCNGCDARLAAELGADLALTAEVQKTSNLILSVSVYIRDAADGALVGGGSADMRGNTDESWARAIDYILENRILRN